MLRLPKDERPCRPTRRSEVLQEHGQAGGIPGGDSKPPPPAWPLCEHVRACLAGS